ncbi:MAG: substrate-binding domain-containing protein [Gammaproteobacteria bacterium]|nr:substrate-binding domain-containing protein [Gammaproteobacteria bacterium]
MQPLRGVLLFVALALCCGPGAAHAADAGAYITLASTTSTQASGFFDYFLPGFRDRTGIEVRVIAVGTGQALKLGENGDADVLLVHDRAGEMKFVRQGYGVDRREVMYNDFILVGPQSDPAGIAGSTDAVDAVGTIAAAGAPFVSRADDSGTHRAELRLWDEARVNVRAVSGTWYKELGAGMGATLNTAAGLGAYTMTDRATWLSFRNRADLVLHTQGDRRLFNQYATILVNPGRHKHVKAAEARAFMDYLVSAEGQRAIGAYRIGGEALFFPNAGGRQ